MREARKTERQPQEDHPYTPTPEGFERRQRAWVHRPAPEVNDRKDANAPPNEPDAS
jgi:hypothetical protein